MALLAFSLHTQWTEHIHLKHNVQTYKLRRFHKVNEKDQLWRIASECSASASSDDIGQLGIVRQLDHFYYHATIEHTHILKLIYAMPLNRKNNISKQLL